MNYNALIIIMLGIAMIYVGYEYFEISEKCPDIKAWEVWKYPSVLGCVILNLPILLGLYISGFAAVIIGLNKLKNK